MKRQTTIILLMLTLCWSLPVCGQRQESSYPNFKECFKTLEKTRLTYNRYNDSIFRIRNHDEWIRFFQHRAEVFQQLYQTNKVILDSIYNYFDPNINRNPIQPEAYQALYEAQNDAFGNAYTDPFISERIIQILSNYYEHQAPKAENLSLQAKWWMHYCYDAFYALCGDSVNSRKTFDMLNDIYNTPESDSLPLYRECRLRASVDLLFGRWVANGFMTVEQYRQVEKSLQQMLADSTSYQLKLHPSLFATARRRCLYAEEELARNAYLVNKSIFPKAYADSLMHSIIERNKQRSVELNYSSYRTLVLQIEMGDITAEQALEQAMRMYDVHRKKYINSRLSDTEISAFLRIPVNILYINDIAAVPVGEKKHNVKLLCNDIVRVYQHRHDQQYNTQYVKMLHTLTTYPRLMRYLSKRERIRFLNTLCVATQVATYAHSQHVASIAAEMMRGVVAHKPELLVGTFDCRTIKDVKRQKKKFLRFILQASIYHDLGKNSIISVVNNDYRPLTPRERDIIQMHPQMGLDYLSISPSLAVYHDTTLGHHKWYNGKGGYPASFDNTKSEIRILIDILTLSDCIQAATERLGRNYKHPKSFETLMDELRRESGTRYNPALIAMIDEQPRLAQKLKELTVDGWLDIYYRIYSQFFLKR